MNVQRFAVVLIGIGLLVLGAGCAPKRKPVVTDHDRKEAALLVSEAQFAINVKDWARAEGLLVKAVQLAPDADRWVALAFTRVRLGNRADAKEAYQTALRLYEDEAAREGSRAEQWLGQVRVLALMGKMDDSRAVLAKAAKRFPNDERIKVLLDPKQFQQMISSPSFKDGSL